MTISNRRAILVLGMPDAGVEPIVRGLVTAGIGLAEDAISDPGAFGASRSLERFAGRMNADLGVSADDPGPVCLAGRSIAASRTQIAGRLRGRTKRAVQLIQAALPAQGDVVLTGTNLAVAPAFWRDALAEAGLTCQVVLAIRNPLALADHDRKLRQRPVRRSLFVWHYTTLEILAAAPDAIVAPITTIATGEVPRSLGLGDGAGWTVPPVALQPRDQAVLHDNSVVSAPAAALYDLLLRWNGLDIAARNAAVANAQAMLDDAMTVAGIGRQIQLDKAGKASAEASDPGIAPTSVPAPRAIPREEPQRPLLIHYHLFKNAGTSVDAMLQANFAERWDHHEFPAGSLAEKHAALAALLASRPDLDAFSSHTALLPPPVLAGRSIFPVVFVRHPLLRLRSAYGFERKQEADTPGAILAKTVDFGGYVETLLSQPRNRQARNFQTSRFAFGTPGKPADELRRALATCDSLPFVGLVEAYDRSIERLTELVTPLFPAFHGVIAHKNVSDASGATGIASRVDRLRDELGDGLFERLIEENRKDMVLFDRVCAMYGSPA